MISLYPSSSICLRATSREAMICWFGDVEVWVKNASLEGLFYEVEILVVHKNHRSLPERGH